jgi:maltose-6'-phosphate glucosidase
MIITIIGGGSTFTAGIVKSIALRKDELEVDEIRLFDLDRDRQEKLQWLSAGFWTKNSSAASS